MRTQHWPTLGTAIALILFLLAAAEYPGGTMQSAATVGFRWTENFFCALFAPEALNGEPNPARAFAIPALLLTCLSLGTVFWRISRRTTKRLHRTAIEIGGPGSMVYGAFVATPLHNLAVNIGVAFLLVALLATIHMLHQEGRRWLAGFGALCLAQLLLSAALYYQGHLDGMLPLLQKLGWLMLTGWLFAIHYSGDAAGSTRPAPARA